MNTTEVLKWIDDPTTRNLVDDIIDDNERMRKLLAEFVDITRWVNDEGRHGEGWKSDRLMEARRRAMEFSNSLLTR